MPGSGAVFLQRIFEDDFILGRRTRSVDNIFVVYGFIFDREFSSDDRLFGVDNN